MNDFVKVQKGDRVWDVVYGWGTVNDVPYKLISDPYKLISDKVLSVRFDKRGDPSLWYKVDGTFMYAPGCNQTLFWDEIKMTPPPKPKRKVQKELWIVVISAPGCKATSLSFDQYSKAVEYIADRQGRWQDRKTLPQILTPKPQLIYYEEEE